MSVLGFNEVHDTLKRKSNFLRQLFDASPINSWECANPQVIALKRLMPEACKPRASLSRTIIQFKSTLETANLRGTRSSMSKLNMSVKATG